jgi:hypothetical protein
MTPENRGNDDYYGKGRVNAYKAVLAARGSRPLAKAGTGYDLSTTTHKPTETKLYDKYPNPFNPTTEIRYDITGIGDQGSGTSTVRLAVLDLLGREVAVLADEAKSPGKYTARFDAKGLSNRVYVYRLEAGNFVQARRMLLVR